MLADELVDGCCSGVRMAALPHLEAYAPAVRVVNLWLEKNGYQHGKRLGNIQLKESVAVAHEKYLLAFVSK
jgi:hypothetical protein